MAEKRRVSIRVIRKLAREAISVLHHDCDDKEIERYEMKALEERFDEVLNNPEPKAEGKG